MKYAVFTFSFEGGPIAAKLQDEGCEVILAVVEDRKDLAVKGEKVKPEDPEEKKRRLSIYDGIVPKMSAKEAVARLLKDPNPEDWFVFFDMNYLFKYAEMLKGKGFKGNFPLEEDRVLEEDRDKAKDFVKKNYPDLKVAEVHEFKTVDEAVKFLEGTQDAWVAKGFDADAKTVCPDRDDPELAREQIISALYKYREAYEKGGFILEKKIPDVKELTPEIHFYDGVPLFTTLDIELKPLGAGNTGIMTGCAADLVFQTDLDAPINGMAFPKAVYDMAKKHEGWFIWDASLLFDPSTDEAYFGEFCANRCGWNALITEASLVPSLKDFFGKIALKENPLGSVEDMAASVRVFSFDDSNHPREGINVVVQDPQNIWLMDVKEEDDKLETTGYTWDAAIVTGQGSDPKSAAKDAYTNLDSLSIEGSYVRPLHDYLSVAYGGSIINRYRYGLKQNLY